MQHKPFTEALLLGVRTMIEALDDLYFPQMSFTTAQQRYEDLIAELKKVESTYADNS